jgi:hypothetical protein
MNLMTYGYVPAAATTDEPAADTISSVLLAQIRQVEPAPALHMSYCQRAGVPSGAGGGSGPFLFLMHDIGSDQRDHESNDVTICAADVLQLERRVRIQRPRRNSQLLQLPLWPSPGRGHPGMGAILPHTADALGGWRQLRLRTGRAAVRACQQRSKGACQLTAMQQAAARGQRAAPAPTAARLLQDTASLLSEAQQEGCSNEIESVGM